MAKFKVGDSPRSLIEINGHHLKGGTWYSPEGIGDSEDSLRMKFPFLVWDAPAQLKAVPEIKESKVTKTKKSK